MDMRVYTEDVLEVLKGHLAKKAFSMRRPLFVFLCGGASEKYHSREMVADFVSRHSESETKNVFCVTAENIAAMNVFQGMDLLLQEALIADVSDCILLFCESPGSFCELGAFTALPTVRSILSVAVDKRYRGSGAEGFLAKGPVADLEKASPLSPWTNVFYVDPLCPVTTPDLTRYLLAFRSTVQSERRKVSQRKPINSVAKGRDIYEVNVGSFVLELLDLVNVLSPICGRDLEEVYCRIKGSSRDKLRVLSPTIEDNFRQYDYRIGYESVLLFMRAMKMVRATERRGAEEDILSASFAPLIRLEDSFMFKGANDPDFKRMIAQVLLRKRKMGVVGAKDVYRRYDC